jgi:hypothetical protein
VRSKRGSPIRGLSAAGDNWAKVIRDAAPAAAGADRSPHSTHRPGRREEFARVACEGFRMPPHLRPWFAATVGRLPGITILPLMDQLRLRLPRCVSRTVFGWLGVATTLPSHRRRGGANSVDGPAHRRWPARWGVNGSSPRQARTDHSGRTSVVSQH